MDSWGYKLISAIEDLVLRLDVYKKLDKHRGCVNTVSFNLDGDTLVSGSDDRRVILWDWQIGNVKLLFHSGHSMMCSKQSSCHTLMIAVLLPLLQMDRFAILKLCNVVECRLNC